MVVGSVVALGLLMGLAGYILVDSAYLMSDACIGEGGQLPVCPARGPDWVRPLPGGAAVLGVLAGLGGVLAGRPVRTPALVAGFVMRPARSFQRKTND